MEAYNHEDTYTESDDDADNYDEYLRTEWMMDNYHDIIELFYELENALPYIFGGIRSTDFIEFINECNLENTLGYTPSCRVNIVCRSTTILGFLDDETLYTIKRYIDRLVYVRKEDIMSFLMKYYMVM